MRDPHNVGPLVVIESPYAGDVERNLRYLRAAMADCFARGENPYASHGLYTQPGVLDDDIPEEREWGIVAGFAWAAHAEKVAVYRDLGMSPGMERACEVWRAVGKLIEYREIKGWGEDPKEAT